LVMERLRGRSLADILQAFGAGTPRDVGMLLRQGAAALGAAHRAGLLHRDIKPENIFLVGGPSAPVVKLLDFGVSKRLTGGADLTGTGMVVGTPAYMSPEQIQGKDLDVRSDIYSFAAIGYEALTGARWIRAHDIGEIYVEMTTTLPRRLSSDLPGVPSVVDD